MGRRVRHRIQMRRRVWDTVIMIPVTHLIDMRGRVRNVIDMRRGVRDIDLSLGGSRHCYESGECNKCTMILARHGLVPQKNGHPDLKCPP